MREQKLYYNTPWLPAKMNPPAAVIGTYWMQKEDGKPGLYLMIRRDMQVRIREFTVLYRFSSLSIQQKDDGNPFYRFRYAHDTINAMPYFSLRAKTPELETPCPCTAVISSVILEDGREISYYSKDFIDPKGLPVRTPKDAEGYLREYFAGLETPRQETVKKPHRKLRRQTVRYLSGAAAVLMIGGLVFGVNYVRSRDTVVQKETLAELMEEHRYSEAYRMLQDAGNTEKLGLLCQQAAAHYLADNNYEKAYLYASAAPEPFPEEIINMYVGVLLTQDRQEEAFVFLREQDGDVAEAMQKVCRACVNRCLAAGDYTGAYTYAREAPQSLEAEVIGYLSDRLIHDGYLDDTAYSIVENITDDAAFDSVAQQTIQTLCAEKDYDSAAVMGCQIRSAETKAAVLAQICGDGMKWYINQDALQKAAALYDTCASGMHENQKNTCLQDIAGYCKSVEHQGGTVYFMHALGKSTAGVQIGREDLTIRSSLAKSYFLLTASQKRAYHANPFDLYKEAYLITDGKLDGTEITDAVSVSTSEYQTVILRKNGSAAALDTGHGILPKLPADKDFVQVDTGLQHVLLLKENGRVTAVGSNTEGQCNVTGWRNIVKVAAGADFSVGLRANGTLAAAGSNLSGQCNVRDYKNVVDIAACDQTLVILLADGTVHLQGDISMGLKEAETFTGIRRIRAAGTCIIAEKTNGTYVMASGTANADCGSVRKWRNLSLYAAGSVCIGHVDKNGKIIIEGDGAPVYSTGE